MIPPRPHKQEENVDSWLMSYADMITLLMCFFIIFVSVSTPKKDKFSEVTEGLANKFGSVDLSTPFQGVFQGLQAIVETNKVFHDVGLEKTDRSITMELASSSFYKPNSADFDEKKAELLAQMAASFKKIDFMDYRIIIESYTNDVPVSTPLFPSSWELSASRAAHMARFFAEHGINPEHIKASGFGNTHAKVPNLDSNGKPILENRDKNERTTIKLERAS